MGKPPIGKDIALKCTAHNPCNNLKQDIHVLIDTGSNIDCLSRKIAYALGLDRIKLKEKITINGINGNSTTN